MSKVKKEEVEMQTQTNHAPPLPLPKKEKKRLVQGEINKELFDACEKEMEKQGVKIRQVMEYGFSVWLTKTNPKRAAELGLLETEG